MIKSSDQLSLSEQIHCCSRHPYQSEEAARSKSLSFLGVAYISFDHRCKLLKGLSHLQKIVSCTLDAKTRTFRAYWPLSLDFVKVRLLRSPP